MLLLSYSGNLLLSFVFNMTNLVQLLKVVLYLLSMELYHVLSKKVVCEKESNYKSVVIRVPDSRIPDKPIFWY